MKGSDRVGKITLKAARVNAGYSQKKAAVILKISNKTLCNWENGKSFPKQPMIEKMCALYGVPYDAINFAI
jgi:DNA-binding XRE family transcriptional regulator